MRYSCNIFNEAAILKLTQPYLFNAVPTLNNIVHNYSKRSFEANVKKCAVVIFSKVGKVLGGWVWDGESLLVLDSYCYLGIEFSSDGS